MDKNTKKALQTTKFRAPKTRAITAANSTNAPVSSTKSKIDGSKGSSKDFNQASRPKTSGTVARKADLNITQTSEGLCESSMTDADFELAYSRYLESVLAECMLDEAVERDKTEIDIQLAELTHRFEDSVKLLEKTQKRLDEISFACEREKLLELKENDCQKFYELSPNSETQNLLNNLTTKEQSCLDKIETKNVDFGYQKESGHKQLLDALTEAITGFEDIRKNSKFDLSKLKEMEKTNDLLKDFEKESYDLTELKNEFVSKFPAVNEKILISSSEKLIKLSDFDDEDEN